MRKLNSAIDWSPLKRALIDFAVSILTILGCILSLFEGLVLSAKSILAILGAVLGILWDLVLERKGNADTSNIKTIRRSN